jgi:hypothetical protein
VAVLVDDDSPRRCSGTPRDLPCDKRDWNVYEEQKLWSIVRQRQPTSVTSWLTLAGSPPLSETSLNNPPIAAASFQARPLCRRSTPVARQSMLDPSGTSFLLNGLGGSHAVLAFRRCGRGDSSGIGHRLDRNSVR